MNYFADPLSSSRVQICPIDKSAYLSVLINASTASRSAGVNA